MPPAPNRAMQPTAPRILWVCQLAAGASVAASTAGENKERIVSEPFMNRVIMGKWDVPDVAAPAGQCQRSGPWKSARCFHKTKSLSSLPKRQPATPPPSDGRCEFILQVPITKMLLQPWHSRYGKFLRRAQRGDSPGMIIGGLGSQSLGRQISRHIIRTDCAQQQRLRSFNRSPTQRLHEILLGPPVGRVLLKSPVNLGPSMLSRRAKGVGVQQQAFVFLLAGPFKGNFPQPHSLRFRQPYRRTRRI